MRHLIIIIAIASSLVSCEESITLDLDQTPSRLVIEAQVTNKPGYQYVRLSKTADFYQTGKTPRVTNAQVIVRDDLGKTFTFVHNPRAHADSAGIYVPQSPFAGEIGRTYTLRVDSEGEVYTAEDKMVSVIPIDSLKQQISEDEEEDPDIEGKIYELLMFAREPQNESNFYLFKFFRNDSLVFDNDTDIYFTDDEFLAEKIDGVATPVYYALNDLGRVEVFSLSRVGYIYYSDLWSLLNNDAGGMFGPIPSSPRTNITNGAVGFFQVSAINSKELRVE
jgi:hypothetical protein